MSISILQNTLIYKYICIDVDVQVEPVPLLPLCGAQMLHNASIREQRSRDMTKQQSVTYE